MSLIADLQKGPSTLPVSSRFTVMNGVVYLAAGLLLLAWPAGVQVLFGDPEFVGREEGLIRVLGMAVAIIGWSTSSVVGPAAGRSSRRRSSIESCSCRSS